MKIKKIINWRVYFLLLSASFFSIIAVIPYILNFQGDILKAAPIPLSLVILIIVLQSTIFFAILIFIGLMLSNKLGLQMPVIKKFAINKKIDFSFLKSIIKTSVLLGVLTGVIIILLDYIFSLFGLNSLLQQSSTPAWQGFLACFYGGIAEEIAMRLFLMTSLIWLIGKIVKIRGKFIENNLVVWLAIFVAAFLFGVGHLPITSELTALTPLVIFRALLLNGIGGVIFGWLYWKKGLESAMIAHFSADIILHVFFPFILIII